MPNGAPCEGRLAPLRRDVIWAVVVVVLVNTLLYRACHPLGARLLIPENGKELPYRAVIHTN